MKKTTETKRINSWTMVDRHQDVVRVLVVLKVDVARNVADARPVEEGVDEVRGIGLVGAVGGQTHRLPKQHGRIICATEGRQVSFVHLHALSLGTSIRASMRTCENALDNLHFV